MVYLDQDTTVAFLGGLRSCANEESRLAASLSIRPDGTDLEAVLALANARRPNSAAEPWRTILTVSEQHDLLARAGWSIAESTDDAELEPKAPPRRSLLAVARPVI